MRVEEARPEKPMKRKAAEGDQVEESTDAGKSDTRGERRSKRSKKAKNEDGVLPGVELPEGRNVKRGWTGEDDSKKAKKSKKESEKEKGKMVFRANVPHSKSTAASEADEKISKSKDKKHKRSTKNGAITDVTEFDKTTKHPAFLKENQVSRGEVESTTYVDGKGWVDQDGKVVEEAKETRSTRKSKKHRHVSAAPNGDQSALEAKSSKKRQSSRHKAKEISTEEDDHADEDAEDAEEPSSDAKEGSKETSAPSATLESIFKRPFPPTDSAIALNAKATKSSKSSKKTEANRPFAINTTAAANDAPFTFFSGDEADDSNPSTAPLSGSLSGGRDGKKRASMLQIDTGSASSTGAFEGIEKLHPSREDYSAIEPEEDPTEALKRAEANAEANAEAARADAKKLPGDRSRRTTFFVPPQTPFTRRDLETRGLRSAAPTPDTAAIARKARGTWPPWRKGKVDEPEEEDDEDEDEQDDEEQAVENEGGEGAVKEEEEEEETEFDKRFKAENADYNKNWKTARRMARKEMRQAENRKRRGGLRR